MSTETARSAVAPAALPVPRFTPAELSALLGETNSPTAEQSQIISSPLSPRLVIAGAGSGKTATMADRVVWLVANGWVRPEEVLGVTFTRKAAGELASRIRAKLAALQRIAASDTQNQVFPAGLLSTDALEPKVSTYHSYASGIVSDYGLRLGVERDVVLLGGAQAFQLASEVVEAYDGDYEHFRSAKSTLVKAVIQLAGECAEHLQEPAGVRRWLLERVAEFEQLPYLATATKNPSQAVAELSGLLRTRASVADMVGRYTDAKRARGALDFGDLVALAARVANEIPLAAETERQRYKVVLLDEFQDTSHAQLVLFSRLFSDGHAVTAVGDPNQSIYGFRGASAGQLFHFVREFPARLGAGERPAGVGTGADAADSTAGFALAPTSYLTTAWRNGRTILSAANVISAPLSAAAARTGPAGERDKAGGVEVPPLQPSPAAVQGRVVMGRFGTDEDEAAAIAGDVLKFRVTDFSGTAGEPEPPAMAVLCRRRAQMECIRREFEVRGIPYEIVGLGGLLDTPEIVDLVATLRVLADPGRSDSLMRLLAGARWRIGPADLMALRDWSSFLARRRGRPGAADDDVTVDDGAEAVVIEGDLTDAASLIEALDWLPRAGWTSVHGRQLGAEALERLLRLSAELRQLRGYMGDDLTTLLGEVERAMLLDIEVAARPGISIHQARRNLDAFQDAAAGFLHTSQRVDVLAFLAWLEAAAAEENGLDAAAPEVNHEAVQLLTVHASKGLEWDVVFVPGLNAGAFPSSRDSRWSSGSAALPWPLRGDRSDLPQWDLDHPDQKGWLDAEKDFKSAVQVHGEAEERRLAYVAYTRAKHVLWVSSAAWVGSRAGMADMSPFLAELEVLAAGGAAVIHPLSVSEESLPQESPLTSELEVAGWPYDPLEGPVDPRSGARLRLIPGRRTAMESAAGRVLGSMGPKVPPDAGPDADAGVAGADTRRQLRGPAAGWADEAATLLERRSRRSTVQDVHLPGHISASTLVDLEDDAGSVVARLRRPVPREPGMSARKGTAFHAWVEEYFGAAGMLDLEEAAGSDGHIDAAYGLDSMVETFRQSEWADRAPAYVEVPVETRVGDVVVRGRIDAVFRDSDGGWDLVDWKTGRRPSAVQLKTKSVQLAVYRLAWARLKEVPLDQVRAAFYYVADDAVVRPHDLGSAERLEQIVAAALGTG
ncbi:ATP-dependent DNA helicase [Arthrobacter sp. AL08]|uniref:ATP-dependent helicase n=1 Tax=unclassified Arthrobacter TaxID=235627 RepID=UPI001CFF9C77|nr:MULTISPECIES: ATP-dependent DNA helicase [unclassified Arthrobacter]MCB5281129.1 ATP-dependent DNA helicase PcrA [Arthrobacter sp. ES1]MDI3241241.1 ATP-dependent DNA helicase [Arthrobacter sp. AL05]MDI3277502.1 ATP-dependent DNA helicase [Arthrobacter sp. AL08]WGZ78495.1 ATP-dependent DNA helicase [Arthrobacter sp. EM1]